MASAEQEIRAMIDRETQAWTDRDADLLMTLFHPAMVWSWPQTNDSLDPLAWDVEVSLFSSGWLEGWRELFACDLIRNSREIRRIVVSPERDAAWAVVDVDTAWRDAAGKAAGWKGRACKSYARVGGDWKMIAHVGL